MGGVTHGKWGKGRIRIRLRWPEEGVAQIPFSDRFRRRVSPRGHSMPTSELCGCGSSHSPFISEDASNMTMRWYFPMPFDIEGRRD